MPRSFGLLLVLSTIVAIVSGCSALDAITGDPELQGPGKSALDSNDPTCSSDDDCAAGEQCIEGLCQMQRCATQKFRSVAPLGAQSYFAVDRELLVVSDDSDKLTIDGYEPTNGSFAHPQSQTWAVDGLHILDVAGGNLTGKRPETVVAVASGSTRLHLVSGGAGAKAIDLGFQPAAVATGDVDRDSVDEAVVLGQNGELAICKLTTGKCDRRSFAGTGKDVAVADVDGDGFDEPIVVVEDAEGSAVTVVNLDSETTKQSALVRLTIPGASLTRVTTLDLDKGGAAEIVVLEDGGYVGFADDTLHFLKSQGDKLVALGTQDISSEARDILGADTNGDDVPELMVLEDDEVEVFSPASASSVSSLYKSPLSASVAPSRLGFADVDGDSPTGTLDGDAQLVPGPIVPLTVMVYPPYSKSHSDGQSMIVVGAAESESQSQSSTVSLNASVTVGLNFELPVVFKAGVSGRIEAGISKTRENARSLSIGERYLVAAKPELEGTSNGAVVLSCACYHAYNYKVDDPAGKLGAKSAGGKMSVFVPVGGQTSLWSLKRYNALAKKLGTLPTIDVPYVVGDATSYPKKISRLDGTPIPSKDLLFTAPRDYRVSDVAMTNWDLTMGESQSNSEATSIGIGLHGTLAAGPIYAESDVSSSLRQAYSVSAGRSTSFGGTVPPIRNNAQTPEDEHELYAYGFTPVVYRQAYKAKNGIDGGYYVVTYNVTK